MKKYDVAIIGLGAAGAMGSLRAVDSVNKIDSYVRDSKRS